MKLVFPSNFGDALSRIFILFLYSLAQGLLIKHFFIKIIKEKAVFYGFGFVWLLFSILWLLSYLFSSWGDPGSLEGELKNMGYLTKDGELINLPTEIDSLPRCPKCNLPKPERTHHCSTCNKCFFRFDHHCPVIGNCVALYNTKSFMLFLCYSGIMIYLIFIASILGYHYLKWHSIIPIVGALFALFVGSYVIIFGLSYVPELCANRTTLERIINDNKRYGSESMENFKQIFGNNIFIWFIPTKPLVSGFFWNSFTHLDQNSSNPNNNHEINLTNNENETNV